MAQGSVLAELISKDPRRIVVVISGDLSHMYQYDCTEDWYTPAKASNLYVKLVPDIRFRDYLSANTMALLIVLYGYFLKTQSISKR